MIGEQAIAQASDASLFEQSNPDCNSIAMIVQHMQGNMLSRWTDFMTTDGEKEWRNRDAEFEVVISNRQDLLDAWDDGWNCVFSAIDSLTESDLGTTIYIRNMGHTVIEALHRQLAHYPYHIGQIVHISKMAADQPWQSLSIPKGNSVAYNTDKFSKPKHDEHFTSEFLKKDGSI